MSPLLEDQIYLKFKNKLEKKVDINIFKHIYKYFKYIINFLKK